MPEAPKKKEKSKIKLKLKQTDLKEEGSLIPAGSAASSNWLERTPSSTEERLKELEAELNASKKNDNATSVEPKVQPAAKSERSAEKKNSEKKKSAKAQFEDFSKAAIRRNLFESHGSSRKMVLFWGLVILSIILSKLPGADIFFIPLNQFATMLHEMGHALIALATGGWVSGMTIVADGVGHGGLTNSHGGIEFLVIQAGYMGTTIFGCLLVYLSQFPRLSKGILIGIGSIIALATIFFMAPGLLSMQFLQVLFSMLWALAMAAALIYGGLKLKDRNANLVLLFLAIYTAMDSLRSIAVVMNASMFGGNVWSDATVMQNLYFLPAIFWSFMWATLSVVLLGTTIWYTYGLGSLKKKK